jgi:hypothetical protein
MDAGLRVTCYRKAQRWRRTTGQSRATQQTRSQILRTSEQLNFNAVGACLSIVIVGRLVAGLRAQGTGGVGNLSAASLQRAAFLH